MQLQGDVLNLDNPKVSFVFDQNKVHAALFSKQSRLPHIVNFDPFKNSLLTILDDKNVLRKNLRSGRSLPTYPASNNKRPAIKRSQVAEHSN